jgi:hypothetical protein
MTVAPAFQSTFLGQPKPKIKKQKAEVKNGNNKRRKKIAKRKA